MLWEIVNGQLIVSEHALMIEPFKTIWSSDPDIKHSNALKVFMYVELVCSPKKSNPYFGYNEEDRVPKVKREVFRDENYQTTTFMMQGVMKYKELLEHSSPTYSMLMSTLAANEKLNTYLNEFDFDERNKSGMMIIKPSDITKALKEIPDIAKGIILMIEKIKHELVEDSKTRSNREIGQYERPKAITKK